MKMFPHRDADPAIEIRFQVGSNPTVTLLAISEGEAILVRAWLQSRPDLAQLVDWCAESSDRGLLTLRQLISEAVLNEEEAA